MPTNRPQQGKRSQTLARRGRRGYLLRWMVLGSLGWLTACGGAEEIPPGTVQTAYSSEYGALRVRVEEIEEEDRTAVRVHTQVGGQTSVLTMAVPGRSYELRVPLQLLVQQDRGAEGLSNQERLLQAQQIQYAQQAVIRQDYDSALSIINNVLAVSPDHVQALTMKGSIHYALGNVPLAESTWRDVLHLDPGNQEVLEFLRFIERVPVDAAPPEPSPRQ